jgi:hypothetical protein
VRRADTSLLRTQRALSAGIIITLRPPGVAPTLPATIDGEIVWRMAASPRRGGRSRAPAGRAGRGAASTATTIRFHDEFHAIECRCRGQTDQLSYCRSVRGDRSFLPAPVAGASARLLDETPERYIVCFTRSHEGRLRFAFLLRHPTV